MVTQNTGGGQNGEQGGGCVENVGAMQERNASGGQKDGAGEQGNSGAELREKKDTRIEQYGQALLARNDRQHRIHLLSIIGEIEGHQELAKTSKTTKYEHVLPQLAEVEDNEGIDGLLLLINTIGGAVESGLAIAEMIASMSKPTVSLVIGDSHSIGVPLAVAADYSFIVPSATMILHPVRMSGTVIGAPQTYDYFQLIQNRIVKFISSHSGIEEEHLEGLMLTTGILTNDLGTILVGSDAVEQGLINEVGGISDALAKLHSLVDNAE